MSQKPNPAPFQKGDVSYLRATAGIGPPLPIAPSPLPGSDNYQAPIPPQNMNDRGDREELLQRELEEVRARAAQMEKTMRWWSDCTANWREKWSKVRNERNKARDENRQLRAKLDACIKENNTVKREKEELVNQNLISKVNTNLDKNIDDLKSTSSTSTNADKETVPQAVTVGESSVVDNQSNNESNSAALSNQTSPASSRASKCVVSECKESQTDLMESFGPIKANQVKEDLPSHGDSEGSLAEERLALLELKLDESLKTVLVEREEKAALTKSLDQLQQEISTGQSKVDDIKQAKQEALLEVERLKQQHRDEVGRLSGDLEEESTSRSSMDRRLAELRQELEKLQKENADEWGRRERLETERCGLERDNKKLQSQVRDLGDQLERRIHHASTIVDSDLKSLQTELIDKTKELSEVRHTNAKLKKSQQENVTELEHSRRRLDQYDVEVKKLRGRIEELKRDLATAEDEVDAQTNSARRVQRSNDELQEQVENLQMQLEHVQSRLRRTSQSIKGSHSSLHSATLELDDSGEDSEDT